MQRDKHTMSFQFGQAEKKQAPADIEGQGDLEEKQEVAPIAPKILTWNAAPFAQETSQTTQSEEDDFIPETKVDSSQNKVVDLVDKKTKKSEGDAPFWDDGNRLNAPKLPPKGRKRIVKAAIDAVPWNLVMAVVSAIVVGLGLGFVVYKMVVTDAVGTASESGENWDEALAAAVEAGLPTFHINAIQGAAFDTSEQGQPVVKKLQKSGLPAALFSKSSAPAFLFVGVAPDQAVAKSLSDVIEEKGQETYVKTYTVEGGLQNLVEEEAVAWFLQAQGLYHELIQETSRRIVEEKDLPAQVKIVTKMEQKMQGLTEARDRAFAAFSEEESVQALEMHDALARALDSFASYKGKKDEKAIWQAQQALLDTLSAYEQMITALSAT